MLIRKFILFILISIILILVITINTSCSNNKPIMKDKNVDILTVAVSIIPQVTFVKQVTGDHAEVVVMIPPGKSPANYQPKPEQLKDFSRADIYFSIGVPAEKALLDKAKGLNKNMHIINLANIVSEKYPDIEFSPGKRDPHIWLSPKRVCVIVDTIAQKLSNIDKKNEKVYLKNAREYIDKLNKLDRDIKSSLEKLDKKTFIVYHPAFGYFADDYNMEMISLEKSGKDININSLERVINKAKKENIKVIFYQKEIDSKKVSIIAKEINGDAVRLDPLAPDYIDNMYKTVKIFNKVMDR